LRRFSLVSRIIPFEKDCSIIAAIVIVIIMTELKAFGVAPVAHIVATKRFDHQNVNRVHLFRIKIMFLRFITRMSVILCFSHKYTLLRLISCILVTHKDRWKFLIKLLLKKSIIAEKVRQQSKGKAFSLPSLIYIPFIFLLPFFIYLKGAYIISLFGWSKIKLSLQKRAISYRRKISRGIPGQLN
jgi:hypothetical protein